MTAARKLEQYYDYPEVTPISPPKRQARKKRVPVTLKICLVATFFVALSLLYLQLQVTSYYLSMELVQMQEQVNSMQQRNDHIMLRLESQRSLKQIEQIARTELGMIDPTYSTTIVLDVPSSMPEQVESVWMVDRTQSGEGSGFLALLVSWVNNVLPLGGVEAGTLQR